MAKKVKYLDPFNGIYGLPPSSWVSDEMIINSMPILEITPAIPNFDTGLNLFKVVDAQDKYLKILANHGYSTSVPIRCAFLADNFPTDTFTNDYGETFLQKFTDVASQGVSQLIQMTGQETLSGAVGVMGEFTKNAGEGFGEDSMIGGLLKSGGGAATSLANQLESYQKHLQSQGGGAGAIGGGVGLVNKMMGGHRVDFPQVWRNSGFTPSYTATIRLYNPNPGNQVTTDKYIVGPLAVLLCLAIPRSDDGKTYNWPFFHKVRAKGIYNLDPAVITNIAVIKGGDQQQIGYNQKLGIVDVRIDFASLYGSMLVEEGKKTFTNRPTLRTYLDALNDTDKSLFTRRNLMNQVTGAKAGAGDILDIRTSQLSRSELLQIEKNEAAKQRQAPAVEDVIATNRVSRSITALQSTLEEESDPGFVADTIENVVV